MPLDTAPLSTKRRIIAFIVLLTFLGGSLALAQLIVTNHKGGNHWTASPGVVIRSYPVKYFIVVPEKFIADDVRDSQGNVRQWTCSGPAGNRQIERIDFPLFQYPQINHKDGERIVHESIKETLDTDYHLDMKFSQPIAFGGHDASLFIGADKKGKTRAYVVLLGLRDHYIALIYSGDKDSAVSPTEPLSAADLAAVVEICNKSRVFVVGAGQAAPQQNTPALQTVPQSVPSTTPRS